MPPKKGPGKACGDSEDSEEVVLQGVIMAESFDNHFQPATENTPRCLLPLCHRPLLSYSLQLLSSSGVHEAFVYCVSHAHKVQEWLRENGFTPEAAPMKVRCISNPDCRSFGDAMRDLDAKGLLRGDFILAQGDTVSNVDLAPFVERHKAAAEKDKNCSMSLVMRKGGPGHPNREVVVATTGDEGRILHHQRVSERRLRLPLELFEEPAEVRLHFDLVDAGVSVCSLAVPPLFQDNFDCQTMDEFVKGVIQNDLLDNTLYLQLAEEDYAARVSCPLAYLSVAQDVLARWMYPQVPDEYRPVANELKYHHSRHNIYRTKTLALKSGSSLEKQVLVGPGSTLGENSVVTRSCIGENVSIGRGVRVADCVILDGAVIGDNCRLEGSLIGVGAKLGDGSSLAPKCILGDGVEVEPGSEVAAESRLVREKPSDDDGWSDDEEDARMGSDEVEKGKYGLRAHLFVTSSEAEDSDEDSDEEEEDAALKNKKVDLWGTRLGDSDSEDDDDSSSEDGDSDLGIEDQVGDIMLDYDAKISVFQSEVLESLQRGAKEPNLSADNLVLEINSSRHAYAATASQVVESVLTSILTIALESAPDQTGAKLLRQVQATLNKFKALVSKYCTKSDSSQRDTLRAFEAFCHENAPSFVPIASKTLHFLYDHDLISEEALVRWFRDADGEAAKRFEGFAAEVREKVRPLIEWLEEDSSEEEDDESD